jgi:hypothetical protein
MKRRGRTIRIGDRVWRVMIPNGRCRFGRDGSSVSFGWLIVTRLREPTPAEARAARIKRAGGCGE